VRHVLLDCSLGSLRVEAVELCGVILEFDHRFVCSKRRVQDGRGLVLERFSDHVLGYMYWRHSRENETRSPRLAPNRFVVLCVRG